MPAIASSSPISAAKRQYIQTIVQQAVAEDWTLGELASALGVTKQTASTYLEQENCELVRLIRPARSSASQEPVPAK